jgi:xanthosine utilization system XapX-like protein
VPFTVNVNPLPPAVAQVGLVEVIVGDAVIVNVATFDVAPQGVTTVIDAVPAVAISEAGTVAVSCVAETKVVVNAVAFHFTVEPETKLVPFTVNVNCGPPATAQFGLSEVMLDAALMVITSVCCALVLQGVAPLLAVIMTLVVPAVVGVPDMTPVLVLTLKPAGSGLAVKLVGLLVAVIV